MAVSLFMRFQVKDFASWLNPAPSVPAQEMKKHGVTAHSLHRSPSEPNTLILETQLPDAKAADAYMAFVEGLPGEMKNWLSTPGTVEWWVGDDVPGYIASLRTL